MSKLGEIFLITSGGTPNRKKIEYYQNGTIPWVKTGDLKDKYVSKQIEYITELGLQNSSAKLFPSNTVLLAMYGATIGACSILPFECATNQACAAFLPSKKVLPEYLYYFLLSHQEKFIRDGVGGAQPNISAGYLKNVDFELLSLEKQKQIAENLDKVTHLIDLCNQMLDKLDLLVKSRFIEMFGEPETNPYNFSKVNMTQVISDKVSNGFFAKREEYCIDGNISILGVTNVVNRMYSNIENLPKTNGTISDIQKYHVKYGDMLFCRSSLVTEGIGKASIVPQNVPKNVLFECHVIRVPLDLSKCNPEFMQVQSTTNSFRNQIISQSKTATMTTISQDGILKTNIILPPIELQNQFSEFVQTVDKSKLAVKQLLEKAETLKKSLMQEYFSPQKGAFPHES